MRLHFGKLQREYEPMSPDHAGNSLGVQKRRGGSPPVRANGQAEFK